MPEMDKRFDNFNTSSQIQLEGFGLNKLPVTIYDISVIKARRITNNGVI
jgi:hypothetical protein